MIRIEHGLGVCKFLVMELAFPGKSDGILCGQEPRGESSGELLLFAPLPLPQIKGEDT